jgi:hypothetical protein
VWLRGVIGGVIGGVISCDSSKIRVRVRRCD